MIDPFQVALTFMHFMPKEELLLALENRADHIRIFTKSFERLIPIRMENSAAPRHISENLKLGLAHMLTELK